MNKDCGVSSVTAVILLIAVTVLAAGVLTAAVLSSDIFSSAEPEISAVLTTSDGFGHLVFPDDAGIKRIYLYSPKGEYAYSGVPPVIIPEDLLVSPASISAEFNDGRRAVLLQI